MTNVNPLSNHGNLIAKELIKKDLLRQFVPSKRNPSQKGGDWCGNQHPLNQFFDDPRQVVGENTDKPLNRQSYWWGEELPAPPPLGATAAGTSGSGPSAGANDFYVAGIYRKLEKRRARSPRVLGRTPNLLNPSGSYEQIGPWPISGPKGQPAGWMAGTGALGNPRPRDSLGQICRRDPEQLTKIGTGQLEDFLRALRANEPLEPPKYRENPSRLGDLDKSQCWQRGPRSVDLDERLQPGHSVHAYLVPPDPATWRPVGDPSVTLLRSQVKRDRSPWD